MEVTKETRRVRWLAVILAWLVAATLIYLHSELFRQDLELGNHVGLRGAAVSPTPMKRICPTMYADALMWVRNALDLSHGAGPQMRFTHADNAPYGREVHWNSGLAWAVLGAGWLQHLFNGQPLPHAIEQSMAWFNVPLLLGFILILSTWVARRAGAGAAVFLTFAMVGDTDFYAVFGPNYVDHHGLIAAAVLGLLLGGAFMGVGFWRTSDDAAQLLPDSRAVVRRAAVCSAIWGGIGMWVSAATLIPTIAMMGVAGVVAILLHGRRAVAAGIQLDPDAWRLWGRVGAAVCFFFYLLEYAPGHLGLRLEVNHPVYALGWWGGSEIIAQIAEWRATARGFRPRWGRIAAACAAMAVAPLIIAIGREKVFVVFDPFVTRLSQHVAEGIPMANAIRLFGWRNYQSEFVWIGVTVLLGLIAWWRSRPADRLVVAFGCVLLATLTAMELGQIRWMPTAAGAQITIVLVALAALFGHRRVWVRWTAVAAACIVLCLPFAILRITQCANAVKHRAIDKTDAMQPVYRDIAAALRASQPTGQIVLLASPNASVAIGYYGLFQTIGTLYWENLAGTKAAAEMFSAQTEVDARRMIRDRGVTHIAMVSEDNFLAEYFDLLHPNPAPGESLQKSFGYGLLVNLSVPLWLEQIPYELPTDVPYRPSRVILLKTHFGPPAAEALYESALADADHGDTAAAEKHLDAALKLNPRSAEFWVAKTNLLLNRGDVSGAAAAVTRAVETAEPYQKFTVCSGEASRFYGVHAYQVAAQLYRAAIAVRPDTTMMNNLAWMLATSPDARVRDGKEALAIATKLVGEHAEDPTFLTAYAAALAECGRYPEAAATETRVLELARRGTDQNVARSAEARLAQYRAGKPWRE